MGHLLLIGNSQRRNAVISEDCLWLCRYPTGFYVGNYRLSVLIRAYLSLGSLGQKDISPDREFSNSVPGMEWRGYLYSAVLLALLATILPVSLIGGLIGKTQIDKKMLVRWADRMPLNNQNCVVSKVADACEDVAIHYATNTAFLACGYGKERALWHPGAGMRSAKLRSERSFRESLFKYDIRSGETVELIVVGLDGDFVTHGIDIFQLPNDENKVRFLGGLLPRKDDCTIIHVLTPTLKIHIFAVRHAREGESVSIFEHELGSNVVRLIRDVKHPGIRTANGVAAFYVTNDHYSLSGPLRHLEEWIGPFDWSTDVQNCDASQEVVQCRQVTPRFPGANGLAVSDGRLFVGDARNGTVTIYRLGTGQPATFERQIVLGAAADNLKVVPTTGDVIATVFPNIENLALSLRNTEKLGKEMLVPSAALRLRKDRNFEPELFYSDDGGVLSHMTAMAVDPYNEVAIGGSVLQTGGFAVCRLSKATVRALT
ncbi:hypothetical protein FE257_006240 [Aspergillus nanangensis]|uniref:Uncharacterized protein n=1 Tax=Aspergillus nanangensis TaxID=2582783 RepID=A0AAD4CP20_ASPNN|nr:hypothetical protein FE257_006240 [Aspergillus nanangensis]